MENKIKVIELFLENVDNLGVTRGSGFPFQSFVF